MAILLLVEGAYAHSHPDVSLINNTKQLVDLSVKYDGRYSRSQILDAIYWIKVEAGNVNKGWYMCPNKTYTLKQHEHRKLLYFNKYEPRHPRVHIHIHVAGVNKGNCHIIRGWKERNQESCLISLKGKDGKDMTFKIDAVFIGGNDSLQSVTVSGGADYPVVHMKPSEDGLCQCTKKSENEGLCR